MLSNFRDCVSSPSGTTSCQQAKFYIRSIVGKSALTQTLQEKCSYQCLSPLMAHSSDHLKLHLCCSQWKSCWWTSCHCTSPTLMTSFLAETSCLKTFALCLTRGLGLKNYPCYSSGNSHEESRND